MPSASNSRYASACLSVRSEYSWFVKLPLSIPFTIHGGVGKINLKIIDKIIKTKEAVSAYHIQQLDLEPCWISRNASE